MEVEVEPTVMDRFALTFGEGNIQGLYFFFSPSHLPPIHIPSPHPHHTYTPSHTSSTFPALFSSHFLACVRVFWKEGVRNVCFICPPSKSVAFISVLKRNVP